MQNHRALRHLNSHQYAFVGEILDMGNTYNLNNRSTIVGNCSYIPLNPECSPGCAIGRRLTEREKNLVIELDLNTNVAASGLVAKIGPLQYFKGLLVDELGALQIFHDKETYWTERGLSQLGACVMLANVDTVICNGEVEFD